MLRGFAAGLVISAIIVWASGASKQVLLPAPQSLMSTRPAAFLTAAVRAML